MVGRIWPSFRAIDRLKLVIGHGDAEKAERVILRSARRLQTSMEQDLT
jgi:hypothetical protein